MKSYTSFQLVPLLMTLKYIWRSFQSRLSFPRPFQLSLACCRVARSPSNSWASCYSGISNINYCQVHCSANRKIDGTKMFPHGTGKTVTTSLRRHCLSGSTLTTFQILAAATGKARLPNVESLKRIRILRFFENPKKRDFLRFFEAAFQNGVWYDKRYYRQLIGNHTLSIGATFDDLEVHLKVISA